MSAHKASVYAAQINGEELALFESKAASGAVHGVEEDTERTSICVLTVKEILSSDAVDWSNVGMILSVLQ